MELYWWFRIAALHKLFGILALLSLGAILLGGLSLVIAFDDKNKEEFNFITKCMKIFIFCFVVFTLSTTLTPSKSEILVMFGWDAIKSDSAQEAVVCLKETIK